MSSPLFNFIPGSGLVGPGTFAEVNSGGQFTSNSRILVIGQKSAAGALADNTPMICPTVQEAARLAGPGSQLYEMTRMVRRHAPVQEIHIAAMPVSGGAAMVRTITLANIPASGGAWRLDIAGRSLTGVAAAGDTPTAVATALAAAINTYVDGATLAYLPVTATSALAVVTVTARATGAYANEIEIYANPALSGNIFATPGVVTVATTTPGAGTPVLSTLLGALGDDPFDWIVSPLSDATSMTSAETFLSDATGRWSYSQQLYGHYFTIATNNIGGHVAYGLARNSQHSSTIAWWTSPTPSYEALGYLVGIQLPWLSDDTNGNAARNQSDRPSSAEILPPRDRSTWPNYATRNALLNNGMSTFKVNSVGQVMPDKLITHYRLNGSGQPDEVFRNIQAIAVTMHGLRYLRAGLSYRHANRALALANPGNLASISTPADITADLVEFYGDLVSRGLFQDALAFARGLVVEIDKTNPSRVNISLSPMTKVNPLDILAAQATIYSAYQSA